MEKFSFKLEGPLFKEGIPIHVAIKALENFQSIIDKTYLVATDTKRIGAKERERFYLRAKSIQHSSLIADLETVLAGAQLVVPFVATVGPQNVWQYTLEAFNLLKLICSHKDDAKGIKIETKDSENTNVHIGDITVNFHGPVIPIAEKSLPRYQKLAHMLEKKKIEEISAGTVDKPEMVLKLDDRDLFDLPTVVKDEPIPVNCEIFTFNKFQNIGKLRIPVGQTIPEGDYNFSIHGNQDNVNYIYSMLKPSVTIECLIEVIASPLGSDLIHHLHITNIVA